MSNIMKCWTLTFSHTSKHSKDAVFQQNGAPPRITHVRLSHLDKSFPSLWTEIYSPTSWPAQSPKFAPLNVLYVKFGMCEVYETSVHGLKLLGIYIITEIRTTSQNILKNVWISSEN